MKNKNFKKNIGIAVAAVAIIALAIWFIASNSSENEGFDYEKMWNTLDNFEDKNSACALKISDYSLSSNYEGASEQTTICKQELNELLVKVNRWHHDNPTNREITAVRLDIESAAHLYNAYQLIFSVRNGNYYSEADAINKFRLASDYTEEALDNINTIETLYSDTEYYHKYYELRVEEVTEGKQVLLSLKTEIDNAIYTYETTKS